ncbi:MAG: VIT1/CCC1 transporter family protein [Nitrospira sp.]
MKSWTPEPSLLYRQAALASAGTFAVGALLPLLIVLAAPQATLMWTVSGSALVFLASLGALAAQAGGAPIMTGAARVTFWGALAMAVTAGVGALFQNRSLRKNRFTVSWIHTY